MKTFKLISLLVLVFLAGAVAGVVGTRAVVRHSMRQAIAHPEKIQGFIEHNLSRGLQLDPGQREKLHLILADTRTHIQEVRREFHPQIAMVLSNADSQITAILTPDQLRRYEQLKEENRPWMQPMRDGPKP